jgi:hypothetical protein
VQTVGGQAVASSLLDRGRSFGMRTVYGALALAVIAVGLSTTAWLHQPRWTPDGLMYEARTLEFSGVRPAQAQREAVSEAPPIMHQDGRQFVPNDIAVNGRFYKRRILVPAAAAAIRPLGGDRALLDIAIGAYILLAPALFLLLRLRFTTAAAATGTLAVLVFPPLTNFALRPLTDGAGLLAVLIAVAAMILTVERGKQWLGLWIPAVAVGSITREGIAVPVIAALVLALRRTRNAKWLAATGIAAIAPAMLLIRVSYWHYLALLTSGELHQTYTLSLAGEVEQWADAVAHLPLWDFQQEPLWTLLLVAPLVVFLRRREPTVPARVMRAIVLAAVVYLAAMPNATQLRLEFVLLPAAAFAVALIAERLTRSDLAYNLSLARAADAGMRPS